MESNINNIANNLTTSFYYVWVPENFNCSGYGTETSYNNRKECINFLIQLLRRSINGEYYYPRKRINYINREYYYDPSTRRNLLSYLISTTSTPSPNIPEVNNTDAMLSFIAQNVLIPVVIFLVIVCLIFGVFIIVKSYKMPPVKPHLVTAIVRRRRSGYAPDNHYINPAEIRASARYSSEDRKSLPPPEVLGAARARAAEIHHI